MLLKISLALVFLFFLNRALSLLFNYVAARKLNIPIIIVLESWQDPLWMLFGPYIKPILSPLLLNQIVPGDNGTVDYASFAWAFNDRYATHRRLGPVFAIVSPFKTNILVADPKASVEVVTNRHAFIKAPELYAIFNMFGPNVNTVNGVDWQRHRKVTSPAFKEANCKVVWNEALRQSQAMGRTWAEWDWGPKGLTIKLLRKHTHKLALHVLTAAVFGKSYDYEGGLSLKEPGHSLSYGEALESVLHNISPMLIPLSQFASKLPGRILSPNLRKLRVAVPEFQQYMAESVKSERDQYAQGGIAKDNLLSLMVRANEAEKASKEGSKQVLREDEVVGNLFMFNLAGKLCRSGQSLRCLL